jgi:hypothetical protein
VTIAKRNKDYSLQKKREEAGIFNDEKKDIEEFAKKLEKATAEKS